MLPRFCLTHKASKAPPQNWHARNAQPANKSAPVSKQEETSPPLPHPPAHTSNTTSRLRAPTRITINMAPSFEQLDPEQADYDGEEEIDFSGTPQTHQTNARRHGDADSMQIFASSMRSAWRRASTHLL